MIRCELSLQVKQRRWHVSSLIVCLVPGDGRESAFRTQDNRIYFYFLLYDCLVTAIIICLCTNIGTSFVFGYWMAL